MTLDDLVNAEEKEYEWFELGKEAEDLPEDGELVMLWVNEAPDAMWGVFIEGEPHILNLDPDRMMGNLSVSAWAYGDL